MAMALIVLAGAGLLIRTFWVQHALLEPTPCPVLVLNVGSRKYPFQSAFLAGHDDKVYDSPEDHSSSQHADASKKECPPRPDPQLSNVHRVAGECIGAAFQYECGR
jgi:hypothetical protein